jgi:hypothetical protein
MTAAARMGATAIALGAAGCFYVDPINQRPALGIRLETPLAEIFRGSPLEVAAEVVDPDRERVALEWRWYACTEPVGAADCDPEPFFTSTADQARAAVPVLRADPDGSGPATAPLVDGLRVVLGGRDARGAAARPFQELPLEVRDAPLALQLAATSRYGRVEKLPLDVYAAYSDPDDSLDRVELSWTVYPPAGGVAALADLGSRPGPLGREVGKRLTPNVPGAWGFEVTATDGGGRRWRQATTVTVERDRPPALALWEPAAAPEPAFAPIFEPTLFRVVSVADDVDSYPRTSADPELRDVRFSWSLRVGAGPRTPLGSSTASVAVDPAAYPPGTQLEVRVEVQDRSSFPLTCAPDRRRCGVDSSSGAIQRLTWAVEAR